MSDYLIQGETLDNLADSVRTLSGTTNEMTPDEMIATINETKSVIDSLNEHIDDKNNPHEVTAVQTGAVPLDGSQAMTGGLTVQASAPQIKTTSSAAGRSVEQSLWSNGTFDIINRKDIANDMVLRIHPETKNIDSALQFYRNVNGAQSNTYNILHTGNLANYVVNPNLLDNWYFVNPVNQRGQTEYTAAGYTIDRWNSTRNNAFDVATGTLYFSTGETYQQLSQSIENYEELKGKQLTYSVLCEPDVEVYARVTYGFAQDTEFFVPISAGSYGVTSMTFIPPESSTCLGCQITSRRTAPTSGSVRIIAAKLELGTQQTLAHQDADGNWVLNEIPDYNEELLKCCMSTADSSDTYANNNRTPAAIGAYYTNPNLLDNWYFADPIDQRGGLVAPAGITIYTDTALTTVAATMSAISTVTRVNDTYCIYINAAGNTFYVKTSDCVRGYTGSNVYTIDRWAGQSAETVVTVTENGITIAGSGATGFLRQPIEHKEQYLGKKVTLSALFADGELVESTGLIPLATTDSTQHACFTRTYNGCYITLSLTASGRLYTQFRCAADTSIEIQAVKLELGTQQTLAHQENGVWVLNEIPDYNEQLLKCCMSTADSSDTYAYGRRMGDATSTYALIPKGTGKANILSLPPGRYSREGLTTQEEATAEGFPVVAWHYEIIIYANGNKTSTTDYYKTVEVHTSDGQIWYNILSWNVWRGWRRIATTDYAVNKAGDTMTGDLHVYSGASGASFYADRDSSGNKYSANVGVFPEGNPYFGRRKDNSLQSYIILEADKLRFNSETAGIYSTVLHTGNKNLITPADIGALPTSGTAAAATKLVTARTIDGVSFDGSAAITHYGTCSTAAATAAKTVACTGFTLVTGASIKVRFTVTNTAAVANLTLNVNSTGAKSIKYRNANLGSVGYLAANRTYEFVYDGTYWQLVGDLDTNSTNVGIVTCTTAAATAAKVGSTNRFTLANNRYFFVNISNANTAASALTLNINSTGAKPIYINGTASSASNYTLPVGIYFVYYNGTNYYFRTDGNMTASITGNAGTATKLATARTIRTNLASTSTASFDGSANVTPGVTGTLPVANGGTGATTLTSGRALIGAGTNAVTFRAITNNTATSSAITGSTNLVTMNTLKNAINRTTSVAAADTNYTTYMARGSSLNAAETTPTVNGAIAWTYE